MKLVGRVGDMCGGKIVTGASSVIVEGKVAAHIGSFITPHPFGDHTHVVRIATGSTSVYVEGKPIARIGDQAECAVHKVSTSANTVSAGG